MTKKKAITEVDVDLLSYLDFDKNKIVWPIGKGKTMTFKASITFDMISGTASVTNRCGERLVLLEEKKFNKLLGYLKKNEIKRHMQTGKHNES